MTKYIAAAILLCLSPFIFVWMLYQTAPVDKMTKLYPHLTIEKGRIAKVNWKKSPPVGWLKLKQMPRYTYMSIVIREDWAFYEHFGIDVRQLTLTLQESIEEGRFTRGASTISQQLVKNLFLTHERSLWRKFLEMIYTIRLEKLHNKNKILEYYLNVIEFGPSIYGINSAARFYFKKSATALTLRESAFLAMIIPSPIRYSQSFRDKRLTRFARARMNDIMVRLRQAAVISEERRAEAWLQTFSWEKIDAPPIPPELEISEEDLPESLESDSGGSVGEVEGSNSI
jgi:monofunctional glycosyltransferase